MGSFMGNVVKTAFDYILTLVGAVFISPLLVYIAYRIKKRIQVQSFLHTLVLARMGILNLFLAIPLALKYGGIGCAFATGLAMFLGNGLIMNWYYVKVTGLDITRFWREIGKICAVVVVITILGNSIYNMLKISESKLIFGLSILVYSNIYLIVLYITVMNQDEKDKITSIIKRMGIIN